MRNMSKFDSQIDRMKQMMSYGITESKKVSNNIEYHAEGADGKTYGIIRENSKFYIKVALPRDGEILAEDYDYIGGFRNRKDNEFLSYANALKQLDLKLMSLNEAYGKRSAIVESLNPDRKEEIIVEATEKMKEEIQRQRQIMFNASNILNEDSKISMKNTGVPEAPKTVTSKDGNLSAPFEEPAKAELDKDLKTNYKNKPKDQGEPFEDDVKVDNADMESDKMEKGSKGKVGKPFNEKAKYVPANSVADKKPAGGKVVRVNESEVLTVNDNPDYMDTTKGTKIGSSAPFDEPDTAEGVDDKGGEAVHEGCEGVAMWQQGENQNSPKSGVGEVGDSAPFDEPVTEDEDKKPGVKQGNPFVKKEKSKNDKTNIDTNPDEPKTWVKDNLKNEACGGCDSEEILDEMMEDDAEDYAGFDDEEISFSDDEASDFEENFGVNPLLLGDDMEEPSKPNNTAQIESKINDIINNVNSSLRSSGSNLTYDELLKARDEISNAYKIAKKYGIEKYQKTVKKDEQGNPIKYQTDGSGRFVRKGNEMMPDENGREWEYDELSPIYQRLDTMMNSIWNRIERMKGDEWDEEDSNIEYYNKSDNDLDYEDDEFEDEHVKTPAYNESKKTKKKPVSEEVTKLNDFGKHPAYQKKVMTLPPDTDPSKEGYEDWNDDSVKGDKPFGTQIGSSAPFDEKVKMITDAVMKRLKEAAAKKKR
jgi:hypothetical protein